MSRPAAAAVASRLSCFVLAAAFLLAPGRAAAQVGFESALKDVDYINFFFSCWNTKGPIRKADCPSSKSGYGIEVAYNLGNIKLKGERTVAASWADTTCTGTSQCGTGVITSYKKGEKTVPLYYVSTEFALSYSQFSGFSSTDPTFDLRGSVREIPGVAFYLTLGADTSVKSLKARVLQVVSPYFGVTSGLIQLNGVQALERGAPADTMYRVYSAKATTFQVGAAVGLMVKVCSQLGLFVERTTQLRRFGSVEWEGNDGVIPKKIPVSLDFSGATISAGVQLTLKNK